MCRDVRQPFFLFWSSFLAFVYNLHVLLLLCAALRYTTSTVGHRHHQTADPCPTPRPRSSRAPIAHRSVTFETADTKDTRPAGRRPKTPPPHIYPHTSTACARSVGSISSAQQHLPAPKHGGTVRGRQRCCKPRCTPEPSSR
jgi:hypothetical protein